MSPIPHERALAAHNVIATFPDPAHARKAVDALERAGIDAGNIVLSGPAIEEADSHAATRRRDARVTRRVATRAATRAVLGLVVGTMAGAGVGLLVVAVADAGALALSLAVIGGAFGGGVLGVMTGGISALPMTEAWDLTYDAVRQGRAVIGVHSEDPGDVEKAVGALSHVQPVRLERFDRTGRRLAS